MIQINLLPKEEQPPEPRLTMGAPRARVWIPLVVGAAVVLPLFGIYAMQQTRIASLRTDIRQTEVEMQRLQPQIDRINQLTVEREQLNTRLSVIQGLTRDRYLAVEMMDRLADEIPDYLWLTRVAETGPDQLTVEGMAFSNLMIAELMSRMEESDFFEGIALVVAERAKTGSAGDRTILSFTLTARVRS